MDRNTTRLIVASLTLTAIVGVASPAAAQRGRPAARSSSVSRGLFGVHVSAPARAVVGVPRFAPRIGPSFRSTTFFRPYYSFRPRVSLGFGIYAGYPVGFPYGYGYGYGNSYYDSYPYSSYGYRVTASPNYGPYGSSYDSTSATRTGGLSFDIAPADAAVFIDGTYVGAVSDFSAKEPPLTLSAGRHHIDLRAQGYQTSSFDITVVGGQVIPYQGTLVRIR